jgi:hypothetical protein
VLAPPLHEIVFSFFGRASDRDNALIAGLSDCWDWCYLGFGIGAIWVGPGAGRAGGLHKTDLNLQNQKI